MVYLWFICKTLILSTWHLKFKNLTWDTRDIVLWIPGCIYWEWTDWCKTMRYLVVPVSGRFIKAPCASMFARRETLKESSSGIPAGLLWILPRPILLFSLEIPHFWKAKPVAREFTIHAECVVCFLPPHIARVQCSGIQLFLHPCKSAVTLKFLMLLRIHVLLSQQSG